MTKTFLPYTMVILAAFAISTLKATEKVTDYPYTQGFQEPFDAGSFFLPHWKGNRMLEGVMGQYYDDFGNGALYMVPEGEEMTTVAFLYLDLSGKENTYMDFTVATVKNGEEEDRKRTKLSVAISTDGGQTFGFGMKVGPEMGFENADAPFQTTPFTYPFPPTAANQPNVVIRFQGKAGGGPHLAAMLLIDDVYVDQALEDEFVPFIVGEVSPASLKQIDINFSEPLDPSVARDLRNFVFEIPSEEDPHSGVNATAQTNMTLPAVQTAHLANKGYQLILKLNPTMEQGEYYTLKLNNITDLVGNQTNFTLDEMVHNIPAPGDLIFTEVLFADPSSATPMRKLQFVEVFNPTNKPVPLGGLRIKGAISAHNMPNKKIYPGEFWVITRNAEAFKQTFGLDAWEWKGSWIQYDESHEGEPLEEQQLFIQTTDHHGADYVDHIRFDLGGSWKELNKPGYSMELCHFSSRNRSADYWALAREQNQPYIYQQGSDSYTINATPFQMRIGPTTCGPKDDKVVVCHRTPNGYIDLCIAPRDLPDHLSHGDLEGGCQNTCDEDLYFRSEVEATLSPTAQSYLHISPNPIKDFVTVSASPDLGVIRQLEIFGAGGKQIQRLANVNQAIFSFYLSELPRGIYILRVQTEQGVFSEKIMLQ